MKTINELTENKITQALNKYGAFFAFSNKQVEDGKENARQNGINEERYCTITNGLCCPHTYAEEVLNTLSQIYTEAEKRYMEMYTKEEIISYELDNHEVFYTGRVLDAFEAVKRYGFTLEDVTKVYNVRRGSAE